MHLNQKACVLPLIFWFNVIHGGGELGQGETSIYTYCITDLYRQALGPPQTRVKKQETRNKKQNGLAHLQFLVCVTPKQKKTLLDSRIKFLAKHVSSSQSTIYLKSHGCVHGLQNEMSLINFSTMFC